MNNMQLELVKKYWIKRAAQLTYFVIPLCFDLGSSLTCHHVSLFVWSLDLLPSCADCCSLCRAGPPGTRDAPPLPSHALESYGCCSVHLQKLGLEKFFFSRTLKKKDSPVVFRAFFSSLSTWRFIVEPYCNCLNMMYVVPLYLKLQRELTAMFLCRMRKKH